MDRDLTDLARRNLARYTRYADDITFSFPVRKTSRLPAAVCVVDDDGDLHVGGELYDLITTKHHFTINPAKTRLSDRNRRMEVTGLTINRFPNVPRVFIDRIRGALHAWEEYGYAAADKQWNDRVAKAATSAYEKAMEAPYPTGQDTGTEERAVGEVTLSPNGPWQGRHDLYTPCRTLQ